MPHSRENLEEENVTLFLMVFVLIGSSSLAMLAHAPNTQQLTSRDYCCKVTGETSQDLNLVT